MRKMDGVTMAREIRRDNQTVQIVFITGYSDYISEGYEVAALHYLMKPVNEQKLYAVLDRACEKLIQNERCLNLTLSGEMVRIPLHEVKYLDVHQNYVTVHAKGEYTVKRTLGEFEMQTDISTAFDLQERNHESGKMTVAATSCRMVSWSTFENELARCGLKLIEKGITSSLPDFDNLMYAVVCK